MTERATT